MNAIISYFRPRDAVCRTQRPAAPPSRRFRRRAIPSTLAVAVWAILLSHPPLHAQGVPSAATVLANVRQEYDRIDDYTADLFADVNIPGMKLAPMKAKVYYKKPDRMHIESSGFAMLPRDVIAFNPRMLGEDLYDAVVQGEEAVEGVACLKVKLLAKSDTLRLQRIVLLVDPEHWLILIMRSDPAQGRSAEARFTYAFVDNTYHVPSRIAVSMEVPRVNRGGKPAATERTTKGTVELRYSNYRINKGIDDTVFRGKEK